MNSFATDWLLAYLTKKLLNKKVGERLQLEENLTLEKAINIAQQKEIVEKQNEMLANPSSVNKISRTKNTKQFEQVASFRNHQIKNEMTGQKCNWCAMTGHERKRYPALKARCKICKKIGHYAKVCLKKNNVNEIFMENEDSNNQIQTFYINTIQQNDKKTGWIKNIKLGNHEVKFKMDTGADVNVVPKKFVQMCKLSNINIDTNQKNILVGADNNRLNVYGSFKTVLSYNGRSTNQTVYIVEGVQTALLGRQAIEDLNIIKVIDEIKNFKLDPFKEFPKLWGDIGRLAYEYEIKQQPGYEPYSITVPRKVPIPLLKRVESELKRMQEYGIISQVEEPTDWCSPMVVVNKGSKVRICVDLTKLNHSIKREIHPIPNVESTLLYKTLLSKILYKTGC